MRSVGFRSSPFPVYARVTTVTPTCTLVEVDSVLGQRVVYFAQPQKKTEPAGAPSTNAGDAGAQPSDSRR